MSVFQKILKTEVGVFVACFVLATITPTYASRCLFAGDTLASDVVQSRNIFIGEAVAARGPTATEELEDWLYRNTPYYFHLGTPWHAEYATFKVKKVYKGEIGATYDVPGKWIVGHDYLMNPEGPCTLPNMDLTNAVQNVTGYNYPYNTLLGLEEFRILNLHESKEKEFTDLIGEADSLISKANKHVDDKVVANFQIPFLLSEKSSIQYLYGDRENAVKTYDKLMEIFASQKGRQQYSFPEFRNAYARLLYETGQYQKVLDATDYNDPMDRSQGIATYWRTLAQVKLGRRSSLDKTSLDLNPLSVDERTLAVNNTYSKIEIPVEMTDVTLSGLEIPGSEFNKAKIDRLVVHDTNLAGSRFKGANFTNVDFEKVDFNSADFEDVTIEGAFKNVDLTNARLVNAKFIFSKGELVKLPPNVIHEADGTFTAKVGNALESLEFQPVPSEQFQTGCPDISSALRDRGLKSFGYRNVDFVKKNRFKSLPIGTAVYVLNSDIGYSDGSPRIAYADVEISETKVPVLLILRGSYRNIWRLNRSEEVKLVAVVIGERESVIGVHPDEPILRSGDFYVGQKCDAPYIAAEKAAYELTGKNAIFKFSRKSFSVP